jgi:hypothetical protein
MLDMASSVYCLRSSRNSGRRLELAVGEEVQLLLDGDRIRCRLHD